MGRQIVFAIILSISALRLAGSCKLGLPWLVSRSFALPYQSAATFPSAVFLCEDGAARARETMRDTTTTRVPTTEAGDGPWL